MVLTLGGVSSALAQNAPPAPPPGGHHQPLDFLTPEERKQYITDREKVLSSDSSLKAEQEALKQDRENLHKSGVKPTPEQRKAMRDKRAAFEQKINAAIIKLDPSASPIVDKIVAHEKERAEKMKDKANTTTSSQ
jgi:hypothetical protein